MSGWRPALRIAWREARRHRGRTALVAVLVALPVLVGAFIDVVVRTADPPAEETVSRFMGATADAYVQIASCLPITEVAYQNHQPFWSGDCAGERPADDVVDLAAVLPPGSRWIQAPEGGDGSRFSHGERSLRTSLMQLDTTSPLAEGLLRLRDGRLPRTPREVALTTEAAGALQVAPGDVITSRRTGAVTVVGTVVEPSCLSCEAVYGLPGWFRSAEGTGGGLGGKLAGSFGGFGSFLVDLPDSVDPYRLQHELLSQGVLLAPRAEAIDPPPPPPDYTNEFDGTGFAILGLVVGFGLIEVCLLAGTAFAVGARRQVRDLGLVAAAGGEARHIRRIVLAQGVVTGLVGSLVAIPLVIAGVVVFRPGLERLNGALMGPLDIRPLELLPLVGLGVLAGLAAALVPAFTAGRLSVLDALNRRFKATSLAAQWPRLGLVFFLAGSGLAALGSWLWLRAEQNYEQTVNGMSVQFTREQALRVQSGYEGAPSSTPYVAMLLTAFALAALGLALLAPTLVATVARAARRLPLSARIGLRDAGRHRHRTGPAVAAIMGAVAGSVALAFWAVAEDDYRDRTYPWAVPEGWVQVGLFTSEQDLAPGAVDDIRRLAPEMLPVRDVLQVSTVVAPVSSGGPGPAPGAGPGFSPVWAEARPQSCPSEDGSSGPSSGLVGVADPATLAIVYGQIPDAVTGALNQGKAIVTDCALIGNGRVALAYEGLYPVTVSKDDLPEPVTMPAVLAERPRYFGFPSVLLPPASLDRLELTTTPGRPVIATTRTPSRAEERAFADVLADRYPDADVWVQVERGYRSENALVLAILTAGCAFVTLVGTAIAVVLSAVEGRSDHATLLAVGADPRRRRSLAMAQAGTVGLLGVGLGVVLGGIVGEAMLGADIERPLILPWSTLAQIVIGIPLLGVLIAGIFTRSRLPMVRRIE
jgi:putative ABC transport system permease protein